MISATNLGDDDIDAGGGSPVTVEATLPAGIVATEAFYGAGEEDIWGGGSCKVEAASKVICTFGGTLPPYQRVEVNIYVKAEKEAAGGTANVVVAGGGAGEVSAEGRLTVSGEATPFGVEAFESIPENATGSLDTQAGSHPFQLTTTLVLNAGTETPEFGPKLGNVTQPAQPKDLRVDLPPGLVGNPSPFPQCTEGQFEHETCPVGAQVGVASATVAYPLKKTISEPVFNMVPARGEPARFGFDAAGIPAFLDASVRTGEDYGITVSSNNITQTGAFLAAQVSIWGWPGDPRHNSSRGYECAAGVAPATCPEDTVKAPFLSLPTSCPAEPFTVSVEGDSWATPGKPSVPTTPARSTYVLHDSSDPSIGLEGCNKLSFEPSISAVPDVPDASSATGLSVDVHVPQREVLIPNDDAESDVKEISVKLPAGVAVNPAGADGLEACSETEMGYLPEEGALPGGPPGGERFTPGLPEPFCPNAAKVGIATIKTPLLPDSLEGAVYIATQEGNPFKGLVALYLVAEDPAAGVLVKLAGEVALDPTTGQLTARFPVPQLPFEDGTFEFFGGERAPLATPAQCGTYTTEASFKPWSGNEEADEEEVAHSSSSFQIASGPHGSPCSNPLPFKPALTAGSINLQAGGYGPFTMTMSRTDGEQPLRGVQLRLPPGLLGTLSSVTPCEETQANAGTCGPESLIGETTVSAGVGGHPYTVTGGRVYITGPYHGAPYGLSVVNPAKAGPFDLERTKSHSPACDCLVVRAKIEVNPITSALTVTANSGNEENAIPTILEGIPLQIKDVNVTVNRAGFTFNPTDCNPLSIAGTLTSAEETLFSPPSVLFQVTNCAALAFKPVFAASTAAHNSRAEGASLTTTVTYPSTPQGTEADIAKVKVSLPAKLPARLSTLQKACTEQTFAANPANCPAASRIGEATTDTPVLPGPLSGPAYFVSHGGAKYPELVIVLQGDNVTIDLHGETAISKKGVLTSTFNTVPDAPFSSFELKLPEGPYSALTANGANLCKAGSLTMPTELVAQDGAVIDQSTKVKIAGCPKQGKHGPKRKPKKGGRHKR
ncbi:MAG TPA: hypothetical protein VG147_15110 [Solirubrobacteraceae bacterium]|nr:hypothetical protein [Solirubrobacteraceae bacterium]